MRTICKTAYQFSELTEQAQQKAIEQYRNDVLYNGYFFDMFIDECMSSIKKGLKAFNAELKDWSIDCLNINQSSWKIDADSPGEDNDNELTGQRLRTWILNNYYTVLYERKPYGEYKKRDNGKWKYDRHSKIQYQETNCPFTGICYDEDFLDPIRAFIKNPTNDTWPELLNDAVYKALRSLESECEYYNSDKGIIEEFEANEREFYENGELI